MYFRRSTLKLFILLVFIKLAWVLYYIPKIEDLAISGGAQQDLAQRKDYLLDRVVFSEFGPNNSPRLLSAAFKEEWAIGTLSMTGAALMNISVNDPSQKEKASFQIGLLIERMFKSDIRQYEHRYWGEDALETLDGPNGHIGYLGHLNLLLGMHRLLSGSDQYLEWHRSISKALARRVIERETRYLETFPGQIFIPDNVAAIASLSLFNKAYIDSEVRTAITLWLEYSKANLLDEETGILVPWVDENGQPLGRPRGSYATWNSFYLLQIDEAFARQQAEAIRKHLLYELPFGVCGILEFLPGVEGVGDIDSGPVIFGLSSSGTGFGLATARVLSDTKMLRCLLASAEAVGSSLSIGQRKRYLLAPLIGDAIILAMRTNSKWEITAESVSENKP